MNLKLAACLVALALLVGFVLFLVAGGRGSTVRSGGGAAVAPPSEPESVSLEEVATLPAAPVAVAREAAAPVGEPAAAGSWRGELAGITGRVVESNGRPVAGMRVALLEVDTTFLFDGGEIGAEDPRLELDETVTDGEGRFRLDGAFAGSFHGLGVDLGGPRATIRVVDHALVHRERTDVGDVVLAPYGVFTGRVVDEGGAPVAKARVRAAPLPPEILAGTVHEFRSDSLIAIGAVATGAMGGEGERVIELPDWVRRMVDRFPVPTAWTDAEGAFRLEGVALATVVGGVDKRGHVGVPLGPIEVTGEHDLGQLVLGRGRTVRGVVEDPYGEPVAGALVHAGAEIVPGIAAILQPCGATDAEGRFELTGVAETGQIVAAARRTPHEPWSTTVTADHDGVLLEIAPLTRLVVNVHDEAGAPVSGARIQLGPVRRSDERRGFSEILMALPRPASPEGVFREVSAGRYECASLGAGLYDVTARAQGLAPAFLRTECTGGENEVTLTCTQGSTVELRVIDDVTKAPVPNARASVLRIGSSGFSKVCVEVTDAEGRVTLGPLPAPAEDEPGGFIPSETMLLVQHPRYGDHSADLEPGASPLVVALQAGGTLAGRVHWGGATPTRLYMLTLEYHGAEGFLEALHMPRFGVTDLEGEFRIVSLAPGRYTVELHERFLDQDPLGLMRDDFDVPTLHREGVEIRNGETTELVIDLTPTGRGTTARVVGHVRVDGRDLEGAEVRVRGNEGVRVTTDAGGRFETPPFSVRGTAWIDIQGEVRLADGRTRRMQLHGERVELEQDEVHEIDLDLYPLTMRVQVVDDVSGAAVAEAEVSAQPRKQPDHVSFGQDQVSTGADGEAELVILQPGDYLLSASAEGFSEGSSEVTVPAEGLSAPATVRLPRSVPCAGRVALDAYPGGPGSNFSYLHVQAADGNPSTGAMLEAPDYRFELEGLAPGDYAARIYVDGKTSEVIPFVLGPDGDRELVLEFTGEED